MYLFDAAAIEAVRSQVTGNRQARHDYPALEAANTDEFLSVREVAEAVGLTDRQVWRLIKDGALQGWRWKGMVLVGKAETEALRVARARSGRGTRAAAPVPGTESEEWA